MGVEVGSNGELRVAEDLHHGSGRDVLGQQQGGAGVSQVVEPDAADACFGDELIEQAGQVAWLDHSADG